MNFIAVIMMPDHHNSFEETKKPPLAERKARHTCREDRSNTKLSGRDRHGLY